MPAWIHDRARRIISKNPEIAESTAFAIATQQSHALGKSPKDFGTEEGRSKAKKKYQDPKTMKKSAFVDALPALTGLATGYSPGRSVAGETAAALAPKGRVQRSENFARNAAVIGAPVGGLVAMGLAKKYHLAPRLGRFMADTFPKGLIAEPDAEAELIRHGVPGVSAILGSLGGGAATGAAVGGVQQLRGPTHKREKFAALKPSPMWGTIGGQAKTPAWKAQAGFTPTGMNTASQRLQKSMSTGAFNRDKGLKPLDLGKMQQQAQAAATGVKMGQVMVALTKIADDGGHGGFSTNQYSGVMNPPSMVYASGIPSWKEPPVKTAGPPSSGRLKTAEPGLTPQSRLNSSRSIGAPKLSTPPGPSIAQISKPVGYGRPISGAAKGNHII